MSGVVEAARAAASGRLAELLPAYYAGVAEEDLRGPQGTLRALQEHLETGAARPPGAAAVRVRRETGRPTVLEVVTDDMPFLVDSLTAAVRGRGGEVRHVVHPRLAVRRDAAGTLVDTGGDVRTESWIALELDGDDDPAGLEQAARQVLADVRVAVQDWAAMREQLVAAAGEQADAEQGELLRWLADDHFTFLGQLAVHPDGRTGGELGLLRADGPLRAEVVGRDWSALPVAFGTTQSRSPVHRPAYLEVLTASVPAGELRTVGLLASAAYTESVRRIPVLRQAVEQALALTGHAPSSYDGRDLLAVLEGFPRDELFRTSTADLARIATDVLRLRQRRRLRLFVRRDDAARAVSALIYLPRDRYTTRVRLALTAALQEAYGARSTDYTARVTESVLARLHVVLRFDAGAPVRDVDVPALEARLSALSRSWVEDLTVAATEALGADAAGTLLRTYGDAFPEAYKEDFPAAVGLLDLQRLAALDPAGPLQTSTCAAVNEPPEALRLKIYRAGPLSLSDVLPVLSGLGLDVLDERPYELECGDGCSRWVYDVGLRYRGGARPPGSTDPLLEEALAAIWAGRADSDELNALVTQARLPWRSVVVLRSYVRYLRQTGVTWSQAYVQRVLVDNPRTAALLVQLFEARFDPAGNRDPAAVEAEVLAALEEVASLDADRILRALLGIVLATVRTNFWQGKAHLSVKLDPHLVPGLPRPVPQHEIWVYSPRFEGVHLRFGAVARGGLRWSDRREDVRTEVLGLVKAQMVKNAVIVPTGAKGGFVCTRLPDPALDRAAWLEEGLSCYRSFVRGLLDLTDDLVGGVVVPPPSVVRRDGDDTYLVVAADKGTATFSDTANAVAAEYGFWLGDAFASGGSAGYDHKAMGITARGAWVSVERHFRELGVDVAREPVTVAGIGDMSGDVFGNGMLLSPHLRLVAAFDHRHVFLDPSPDPAASFAERRRLFDLPRSSWGDYDPALLSPGGGVFPRTAKSVPLSPQVRALLGVEAEALTPQELIRAVLTAPVDLLWNGGIGTYVKATSETHAQVGDQANDGVRVDASALRARVVGEGGNLGLTQLGRVEYALAGGRLNTDAIDNSAGVDTSDHEVNFKVLLAGVPTAERDALLGGLTDEVAALVLRDNYDQNTALGVARVQAPALLPVHARLMASLEARGVLDRAVEFLPGQAALEQREAVGLGLTSPELSVLLAYAKISLRAQLLDSRIPEDPWFARALRDYFPSRLLARADAGAHPLRRQIAVTTVVNDVVERGGITFVFRASEETGATPAEVVRAYAVAREVFGFASLWAQVEALDGSVPAPAQTLVLLEGRRLLDRTVRWLLQARRSTIDVAAEVERFGPALVTLTPRIPGLLAGVEAERLQRRAAELAQGGLPDALALRTACLLDAFSLLDVVEVAASTGREVDEVAATYFALSDRFEVDRMLTTISGLPRADRWSGLARSCLRYDLYAALAGLTADVLRGSAPGTPAARAIGAWESANGEGLTRARSTLAEVLAVPADLATMSVALRTVRTLLPG